MANPMIRAVRSVSGAKKETHAQYDHHNRSRFTVNARNMHCQTKETEKHQYCMTNFRLSRAGDWQMQQDQNFRVVGATKDGGYRGTEYSNENTG